ncbi:ABC transporter permease [Uliginosibacterium sp. H1]|uniref:ABC transporter permease n=1 Tax=Uliginosibacterium sp. H1 TaxID=3114757 RepID=UPI002E1951AD|nr:ABC transporter permease [Uliginosibacterium sp. H1]
MLRALIWKELIALSRDLHGLAALFLMPLIFIVVMSMALKDVYSPPLASLPYALDLRDDGPAAKALAARWAERRGQPLLLTRNWQAELKSGQLKYVLIIETGFGQALHELKAPEEPRLRLLAEPGMEPALFQGSVAELMAILGEARARSLATRFLGTVPSGVADLGRFVSGERFEMRQHPTSVQHNVPAWLIFGMFFVVSAMAGLFVQERDSGTLARLASLGVPNAVQITAKAVPYLLVNGVQALLMLAVGIWLMPLMGGQGLSLAGVDLAALGLMIVATSCAAVALALAVASFVRTHGQASAVGPLVNVLMAATGGIMVPTFVMPPVMQQIAAASPMNWALSGMLDVLLRGAGPQTVWPHAWPLFLFALLTLVVAALRFPRRVRA